MRGLGVDREGQKESPTKENLPGNPALGDDRPWTKQRALDDVMGYMDYLLDPDVSAIETVCRLVEGGGTPDDYGRYYVGRYSRISHLAPNGLGVYGNRATCCGKWVDYLWLGTGTQREYDRAQHLPTCLRCIENYTSARRFAATVGGHRG